MPHVQRLRPRYSGPWFNSTLWPVASPLPFTAQSFSCPINKGTIKAPKISFLLITTYYIMFLSVYLYIVGTKAYTPPEFFFKRKYKAELTTVWQLGMLLSELLHGIGTFSTIKFFYTKVAFFEKLRGLNASEGKTTLVLIQHLSSGSNTNSVQSFFPPCHCTLAWHSQTNSQIRIGL